MDVEEAIKNAPLFAQLSKKDITQLTAVTIPPSYQAEEVIIEKGKQGLGIFVSRPGPPR